MSALEFILKYRKAAAVFAAAGWLLFVFSAFRGFHFWYGGFVFFFWLSLGLLNYREDSSVWFLKNRLFCF